MSTTQRPMSWYRSDSSIEPGLTIDALIEREEARFVARMGRSIALHNEAVELMPGGVTSSWAMSRPTPVWVSHGKGGHVWDPDGNEYVDMHAGYGVTIVGHGNPAVVAAVQQRVELGTHFAQPTEDAIVVARNLKERFGLPKWRFTNSGTEATMDAVHLMRAITGRKLIIKVEGTYHGHSDATMVTIFRNLDQLGPADSPARIPGAGVPQEMADLVRIVPFNDLDAVRNIFETHPGQIAGMIIEPMMMNAGIIVPKPGYLEGLRELTLQHGALLAFDEVKTGLVVHPGGVTGMFGVTPDIVCLAKALGGGVPCGAVGGTDEVMGAISTGVYDQIGTFNGNPLTMAAAKATLTEVLTPEAYAAAERLGTRMMEGCLEALHTNGQAALGCVYGFKGSVIFHDSRPQNYREFLGMSTAASHLHFLMQHNGGVWLAPWGKTESWTLSVAHTDADGDLYVDNVARMAAELARLDNRDSNWFAEGTVN